jgi:hypothetical protein
MPARSHRRDDRSELLDDNHRHGRMTAPPAGSFERRDGLEWYRIDHFDRLDPFLMTLVTPTDQWMFISSSGALTAGRHSAAHAIFPYETDDRLHRSGGRSGPVTIVRAGDEVWQPFDPQAPADAVARSISKTSTGDRIRFEERHPGLGLTFSYTWAASNRFGFVRMCELSTEDGDIDVDILDGLVDVLPAGVDLGTQQVASTLVDGYRRSELDIESGVALFTLEALVSDKAEPAESLRATTVWSRGLDGIVIALSDRQIRNFRSGFDLSPEHLVTGRKGGFFVSARTTLSSGSPRLWFTAADVDRDHGHVAELRAWLRTADNPTADIAASIETAHRDLLDAVAGADARQNTADRLATAHHFANVLFNAMRGGLFLDEHRVSTSAVAEFVVQRNRPVAPRFAELATDLADVVHIGDLRAAVAGDADLARLTDEFLPLTFSRRHGDPSRPWNTFRISVDGSVGYEGNWRDIFQNWEALLHSYPAFAPSVVAKFLNASTVDGFNPYRITDAGVDWEMPEEGAWANLGYWGDHQITYLHRLLDVAHRFHPGWLERALGEVRFSTADVPYRLRPYDSIVADPKQTIDFDDDRQDAVEHRVSEIGADGRLIPAPGGGVLHTSLAEKLMLPALSKLSNLVADAGIWMNTQRPEWNDANNALVGNGVSVVTLIHLREYLRFVDGILERTDLETVPIGGFAVTWMTGVRQAFASHGHLLDEPVTSSGRRSLLDALGAAFQTYRDHTYGRGTGDPDAVAVSDLRGFVASVMPFLDQARDAARRADGLFDAYGILSLGDTCAEYEPLGEMLEGQVAALSAGDSSPMETVMTIDHLFASGLYRPDQRSFMLYPVKQLPGFIDKNVVPDDLLDASAREVMSRGEDVLYRDRDGVVRFAAGLQSARHLDAAMDRLEERTGEIAAADRAAISDLYEAVFDHASFTGRSGTMYRYEGIGSVYWHMVSKLLFAIQERFNDATASQTDTAQLRELAERYRRVRAGLGYAKSVLEQGTFPTDPHSHTPGHTGAQQPGMTGQVKEGVLLRWGELGVRVDGGRVSFRPRLLDRDEFIDEPRHWPVLGPDEALTAGTLGFTYCGVPIVYHLGDEAWVRVRWNDGTVTSGTADLDEDASSALLGRTGRIDRIEVGVDASLLV